MQDPTVLIVIKMKELKAASCKMSSGFEFQIIISWGILVEKEKKTLVAHLYACKEGSAVLIVKWSQKLRSPIPPALNSCLPVHSPAVRLNAKPSFCSSFYV